MEFNGTFLITIISFIVFVLLMNKILYAPILSIIEERHSLIDSNYKACDENNSKITEISSEKEELLEVARNNAKNIYNTTIGEYKSKKDKIIIDAQTNANDKFKQSNIELVNLSNEAKHKLKNSMTDLANDIVEKVIGYRSEVQSFDNEAVDKILWEK